MRMSSDRFPKLFLLFLIFGIADTAVFAQSSSVINLWYGNEQTFGKAGIVQRYINVLGNVDPEKEIIKLDFALNEGGFRSLTIGPDTRRLERPGDFNVEIPVEQLREGKNAVLIEAVDKAGIIYNETVEVTWTPDRKPPDYTIDWSSVDHLTDVAQPIDGVWRIEGGKLVSAPEASGYDRVVGFGDMGWGDYEVLVPFEILRTDPASFESDTSKGPALLSLIRWQGHTDGAAWCPQPHCGWEPAGGTVGYPFTKDNSSEGSLLTQWPNGFSEANDGELELNKPYWLRLRAETTIAGNFYSYKLWQGTLGDEPEKWLAQALGGPLNMSRGSFLMVAHHIDLVIGNIQFTPLGTMRNKIVQLITESSDVLVQLPYLILWVIGILWAIAFMRRDPGRGRWILGAFVLLFVTSLIGFLLNENLPNMLLDKGWFTRRLSYVYVAINLIPICGHFLAWAILFKTLWPAKQTA